MVRQGRHLETFQAIKDYADKHEDCFISSLCRFSVHITRVQNANLPVPLTRSMSRVGKCIDNAPIESFFGHFKTEYYDLKTYKTFEELVEDIDTPCH